jgi:hypothetical protein
MIKELIEKINLETSNDMQRKYNLKTENPYSDQEQFAKPIETKEENITSQIQFRQETLYLDEKNFTNIYRLIFSPEVNLDIYTRDNFTFSMLKSFKKDPNIRFMLNAGAIFLVDKCENPPSHPSLNLLIKDGNIIGLPNCDRPTLIKTSEGETKIISLKSTGTFKIGTQIIEWIGSRSPKDRLRNKEAAILYNSANTKIIHAYDENNKRYRTVDKDHFYTPKNNTGEIDLVVRSNNRGKLIIQEINPNGETCFTKGNFILKLKKDYSLKLEDELILEKIEEIPNKSIISGVSLFADLQNFKNKNETEIAKMEINNDPSLTTPNFLANKRYQRAVIGIDQEEKIHTYVFDGAPKTENFKGISIEECLNFFKDKKFNHGPYFCDGGQSARMMFKDSKNHLRSYGSYHYLNQQGSGRKNPLLTGILTGRTMASGIVVYD